jgi:hypothetical protein
MWEWAFCFHHYSTDQSTTLCKPLSRPAAALHFVNKKSYVLAIASICLNLKFFLYFPRKKVQTSRGIYDFAVQQNSLCIIFDFKRHF